MNYREKWPTICVAFPFLLTWVHWEGGAYRVSVMSDRERLLECWWAAWWQKSQLLAAAQAIVICARCCRQGRHLAMASSSLSGLHRECFHGGSVIEFNTCHNQLNCVFCELLPPWEVPLEIKRIWKESIHTTRIFISAQKETLTVYYVCLSYSARGILTSIKPCRCHLIQGYPSNSSDNQYVETLSLIVQGCCSQFRWGKWRVSAMWEEGLPGREESPCDWALPAVPARPHEH